MSKCCNGDVPGRRKHQREGTEPCAASKAAAAAYQAQRRAGEIKPRDSLKPCGTTAAYYRHLRHGEEACDECKAGLAADRKQRRQAKAALTADETPQDAILGE